MSHLGEGDRGSHRTITAGPYTATVSAVGAALDSLTYHDRDLILRNPPTGPMLHFRGALVAPWPNRIAGGRYSFNGSEYQLALTEPERGHALHGLVCFQLFTEEETTESSTTWSTILYPSPGYPFRLQLSVRYELSAQEGLTTTLTARNIGHSPAPFGACPHPYLVAGEGRADDWILSSPASQVLVTDEALIPVETVSLDDAPSLDFREARPLGATTIDHAFTGFPSHTASDEDLVQLRLTTVEGAGVSMRWDNRLPFVQVYTCDRPEPELDRIAVAVEPMSCAPNAFNSGEGLITLGPDETCDLAWTISGLGGPA